MTLSKISPCLWFDGKAEEAAELYVSLFPDSRIDNVSRYGSGGPFPAGAAFVVDFTLVGQRYQALNGGPHYTFSEAISFSIACQDAAEVDHYWDGLIAAGGEAGRCGWLKDPFGVSWQVVPAGLGALLSDPDPGRARRARAAMMTMNKLDLAAMRHAADGAAS
jgi:predicted 3-demethylubiquinone-9 3-methyltransferase (glyoxalase superfamily)